MEKVREVMAADVAFAVASTSLVDVAKLMVQYDCGEIPIVNSKDSKNVIGVITDRDIVCRTLGRGINPMDKTATDCMSKDVITADLEMTVQDCMDLMREHQIRRLPVVNENKKLCGIIAQADIVKFLNEDDTVDLIQEVSRPSDSPSAVH